MVCAVDVACPEGIEPPTHSLEGCCSIQLSYGQMSEILARPDRADSQCTVGARTKKARETGLALEYLVGVQGFEPWTPCSQSRCATRLRHTPKPRV